MTNQVTKQDLFNQSVQGVLSQGCASAVETVEYQGCAYRGVNGVKCAIGHLIKDEFYCSDLENLTITNDERVRNAVEDSIGRILESDEVWLLDSLQTAHDQAESSNTFIEEFKRRAAQVAEKYKLNSDVLN